MVCRALCSPVDSEIVELAAGEIEGGEIVAVLGGVFGALGEDGEVAAVEPLDAIGGLGCHFQNYLA